MNEQRALMPFEEGAKFRYVPDKILSDKLPGYSSGGTSTMPLRKVGFTMGLIVKVELDLEWDSGAPVLGEEGLYALIDRIQVVIGNNQAQPIDLNAAGLKQVQRTSGYKNWGGFDTPAVGKIVPNPKFYADTMPSNGVDKTVILTFIVPFSVNLHQDRHLGMLPTAARGFTANLQIDWAKITTAITGGVVNVKDARCTVDALTTDVPDFQRVQKPRFWIFARRSTNYGKVQQGDNKFEIPQGGILLSLGGIVKANGLRTDEIEEVGIIMAGNDQPYTQTLFANQVNFAARHRQDLPSGEFIFNLLEGSDEGFSGSYRDTIDTTSVGLLEALVNVGSGAALGVDASKNSITIVRTTQHPINVTI